MSFKLDDWLKDGSKVYVFDTRELARRLDIDGRKLAPVFREAVLVNEALRIGSKVIMSEVMVKEYFPDAHEKIGVLAKDMARTASEHPSKDRTQIDSYTAAVFIDIEDKVVAQNKAKEKSLARLQELVYAASEDKAVYEKRLEEANALVQERAANVCRLTLESRQAKEGYEARITELEERLAQAKEQQDVADIKAKADSVPSYEARIEALLKENQRVRELLADAKKRPIEPVPISTGINEDELTAERRRSESLQGRVQELERDLRREKKTARGDDNTILVPADEFNEMSDKIEEVDDLIEEIERLRKAVKIEKAGELTMEDQLELGKRGAAACMADKSYAVVVYHGERIVLPNANHLFRMYEVLNSMKLHGERCDQGDRVGRDNILRFMSDSESKVARERAYERWKKQLDEVGIQYLSFMEDQNAQFCIRDLEKSLQKVTDLLTLRSIYDTGGWKQVKNAARKMGLVNIALTAEPVEAIFKYPSSSSSGNEVRPLQQDAGRDVPKEGYRILRQGQQG